MLNNIKIGVKLTGGFLIIALITAVIGVIGFTNINTLAKTDKFLYEKKTVPISLLGTINSEFQQIRVNLEKVTNDSSLIKQKYFFQRIDQHDKVMDEAIAALKPTQANTEDEKRYEELLEKAHLVHEVSEKVNKYLSVRNGSVEAVAYLHGEGQLVLKTFQDLIEKMVELSVKEAKKTSDNNTKIANSASLFLIVSLAIGILLAIILGLFLSTSITGPLQKGVALMQEMAKGHLQSRLRMTRKDEIGILAKAMDDFSDDLQKNVVATIVKNRRR